MTTVADSAIDATVRRRWGRQTRFLAQSVVLEEIGPPGLLRVLLFLLGLAVAAFLAWAAIAPLAQRVKAVGQVIPSGAAVAVQHLEGGIVRQILTEEGAVVTKGAVLVRLDPAAATSELQQTEAKIAALSLEAERLRAFAEGRPADFGDVAPAFGGLAADQAKILAFQKAKRASQRKVLQTQLQQRKAELASLESQEKTLAREVKIFDEVVTMRKKLHDKGLNSKLVYLNAVQQQISTSGELRRVRADAVRVHDAIAEAEGKLVQLDAELKSEAMTKVGQATGELAQLKQAAAKLRDRVSRLDIRAPVRGVVKTLVPNAAGSVVAPGSTVAEIVPLDKELVVETRVEPQDVGELRPGQPVSVKVSAYEFYRFGAVDGTLDRISPSTFQDKEGHVFYKATIGLRRNYVGDQPDRNPILPGMTVEADINTGSRTVLEYLLKPVYVALSDAFGEH